MSTTNKSSDILRGHLESSGLSVDAFVDQVNDTLPATDKVARSTVYRLLAGREVRLSTWEKIHTHISAAAA